MGRATQHRWGWRLSIRVRGGVRVRVRVVVMVRVMVMIRVIWLGLRL